ncbi:hypothetical protein C6497_02225 [Candidatus Poribacteria bacterium]|nr:MAG: hypothetical protein C6497_02225 [Candidatus Poribacteria bacterium]
MFKKTKSNFVYIVVFCFSIFSILGCERIQQVIEPIEIEREEISIGLVLPLTGRLGSTFGEPIYNALQLAKDEINENPENNFTINFIIMDDMATADGAITAYNKFIEDGLSVILGPVTSSAAKEVFPIAQMNKVVAISSTSAARGLSALGDYVFRIALTTDVLVPNGVDAILTKYNFSKVATLYDKSDVFSVDSEKALLEVFNQKGIEVVATETFQANDEDFSEQLTRIEMEQPDVVFVSSLPPEKASILKQSRDLGITARFVLRTLTEADVEAAGEAAEGTITFTGWGTAVDNPLNQEFVKNYHEKYGTLPNNYSARSYVALYVLAEALANASTKDAMSIRDALANITGLETIVGKFSFNQDGDAVYDPQVLIVKDGSLVLFE